MAQARLTNAKREHILQFMIAKYDEKHPKHVLELTVEGIADAANDAIRTKYPETDMVVLRRYDCTRIDRCLRFQAKDSGRVFGFHFGSNKLRGKPVIADVPVYRGCYGNDVFPVDETFATLVDEFEALEKATHEARLKATTEYRGFLDACRTLDDVESVVMLPADIRASVMKASTALVAISDEKIAELRAEFSEGQ